MNKLVAIFVFVLGIGVFGVEISPEFLNALEIVESNNRTDAVGDNGNAVGTMQIWKTYVDDVNRISGNHFMYEQRTNRISSRAMVIIYLRHYGKRYERITGRAATSEVLARIHNGGPDGWKKKKTVEYWEKVSKVLND